MLRENSTSNMCTKAIPTLFEVLLDKQKRGHWVASWQAIDGRLAALFFASLNQIELMRRFPDVILLHTTCKTNRHCFE